MTDRPNISPVSEANFSPVTGAHLALGPSRGEPSSRKQGRSEPSLLSPAWPIGIGLALVGLIWFWRGAPASTPVVQRAVKSLTRESETERGDARWKAQALASPGDWLFSALDHHRDIEGAFGAAAAALPGTARATALRALATLLTGHSIAEEAVLYPALAEAGSAARSMMAYGEQAMAKTELAKLRNFDL